MAMTLILLLLGVFLGNVIYFYLATVVLVIAMIYPPVFYPLAVFWFGFSGLLGTVMSTLILTLIYIALVMPVGLFRQMIGKDALQLKAFKSGANSAYVTRNHLFTSQDLEKPY